MTACSTRNVTTVDDVARGFAQRVVEAYEARPNERFSVALTGGATARRCYESLAEVGSVRIDWWNVELYWADERCVPADHEDSNQRLARVSLLERVGAADAVHPIHWQDGAEPYQLVVGELGQIDVVHLDVGADGHVAALFPGSSALDADPGRLVVEVADPSGLHSHARITLTFSALARARLVLLTASGESRRAVMGEILAGGDLPATRVRAERVEWIVDRAAVPFNP